MELHWRVKEAQARLDAAELAGCEAREAHWAETSNPFGVVKDSARFQAWQRGWLAQDEALSESEPWS